MKGPPFSLSQRQIYSLTPKDLKEEKGRLQPEPLPPQSLVYKTSENQLSPWAASDQTNASHYTHWTYKHHIQAFEPSGSRLTHVQHANAAENGLGSLRL